MNIRQLVAPSAATLGLLLLGGGSAVASAPVYAKADHYGVVFQAHGVRLEGCRKGQSGVVSVYFRLDTRHTHQKARAKVKDFSGGELGATNFSSRYPRYQRPGRLRAFNGNLLLSNPGASRFEPVIKIKGGNVSTGKRFRVRSLTHC